MVAGAIGTRPKFQVATDPAALAAQEARINAQIQRRGGIANAPRYAERLKAVQGAQTAAGQTPAAPTFDSTTGQANQAISGAFQGIQNLQPMNMDYGAMRQRAEQMAMDSFNRNMQPQFQREESDWRQRMAEQGIDPNSERARKEFEQMKQQQSGMTQNAMTSAFQAGQGEQAQAFNQGVTQQMLPYQQLSSLSPFYQSQAAANLQGQQNAWQGKQNALTRAQQLQMAKLGGGGGMTQADRLALIDAEQAGRMALIAQEQALQSGQQLPNQMGNAAVGGIASGIGAGITGSLLR